MSNKRWPRFFTQVALILLLPCVPAALSVHVSHSNASSEEKSFTRIGLDEIHATRTLLLDARSAEEHEQSSLPGAIPLREVDWNTCLPGVLDRWEPGMRVVVFCGSAECQASHRVAARLALSTGWTDIAILDGGWNPDSSQ